MQEIPQHNLRAGQHQKQALCLASLRYAPTLPKKLQTEVTLNSKLSNLLALVLPADHMYLHGVLPDCNSDNTGSKNLRNFRSPCFVLFIAKFLPLFCVCIQIPNICSKQRIDKAFSDPRRSIYFRFFLYFCYIMKFSVKKLDTIVFC